MRSFSTNVKTLLSNDSIAVFYLVKIQVGTNTLMHTTLPYDVEISGLGYFSADSGLTKVEAPRLTTIVDRVAYKIVYADPEMELKARFDTGMIGSPVKVMIGFFNNTDSILGAAPVGGPLLQPQDIVHLYSGIVDSHGYLISEENETLATFECSSPMADLGQKNLFLTTDENARKFNVNDGAFKSVHQTSTAVSLAWGKI